jgi:hypothetical protein
MYDKTGHDKNARYLIPYTFLLGDYNLNSSNARSKSSARLTPELENMSVSSNGNLNIKTINSELTTLRGIPQDERMAESLRRDPMVENHLANNYDHFTFDSNKFRVHQIAEPECGVIMAFEQYQDTNENSRFELYRNNVSDHLPIYIDFDIRNRI